MVQGGGILELGLTGLSGFHFMDDERPWIYEPWIGQRVWRWRRPVSSGGRQGPLPFLADGGQMENPRWAWTTGKARRFAVLVAYGPWSALFLRTEYA